MGDKTSELTLPGKLLARSNQFSHLVALREKKKGVWEETTEKWIEAGGETPQRMEVDKVPQTMAGQQQPTADATCWSSSASDYDV